MAKADLVIDTLNFRLRAIENAKGYYESKKAIKAYRDDLNRFGVQELWEVEMEKEINK